MIMNTKNIYSHITGGLNFLQSLSNSILFISFK